jgi:serine/threonine protein kinase
MSDNKTIVGYNLADHKLIFEDTVQDQLQERDETLIQLHSQKLILKSQTEFELEECLGQGGMGAVYKAKAWSRGAPGPQDDVCKEVAVKLVTRLDPTLTASLIKEAKVIAQLDHDNIVYFILSDCLPDGTYFVVTQYIKGTDVNGLMEMHRMLPSGTEDTPTYLLGERTISRIPDKITGFILWSVANGLAYAHSHGITHRDVSPGNILVKFNEGSVKLSDFGIAVTQKDLKGSEGRTISGKLNYISPEGIRSPDKVDARSDIYSLGAVGYEMLTGLRPNETFPKEGEVQAAPIYQIHATLEKKLVPPNEIVKGADKDLSSIICRMLAKNPDERYQSAEEFADVIGRQVLFKEYGPTKAGMRDYIRMKNDLESMTKKEIESALLNLSFLKRKMRRRLSGHSETGVWCKYDIFTPYILTGYAKGRLDAKENPARI